MGKKKGYLQNIVDTMSHSTKKFYRQMSPYNRGHSTYPINAMECKLSRYYGRSHGHKSLLVDLDAMGVTVNYTAPSYYGKRLKALANEFGQVVRKRPNVPRREVIKANPLHLSLKLQHLFRNWLPGPEHTHIPAGDRIELIINGDSCTMQIYQGKEAPTSISLTKIPKEMSNRELMERHHLMTYYDIRRNEVRPLYPALHRRKKPEEL